MKLQTTCASDKAVHINVSVRQEKAGGENVNKAPRETRVRSWKQRKCDRNVDRRESVERSGGRRGREMESIKGKIMHAKKI